MFIITLFREKASFLREVWSHKKFALIFFCCYYRRRQNFLKDKKRNGQHVSFGKCSFLWREVLLEMAWLKVLLFFYQCMANLKCLFLSVGIIYSFTQLRFKSRFYICCRELFSIKTILFTYDQKSVYWKYLFNIK